MGTWGSAAWDNDAASDWFAEMFESTKLAEYVKDTLELDPEESADEIRAAAYVLVALGKNYVWPVDELDEHLELAIAKLEAIKDINEDEFPEMAEAIDEELSILREALASDEDDDDEDDDDEDDEDDADIDDDDDDDKDKN